MFIEENKFLGNHNYGVYAYDPAGLPKDIYIKGNYFSGIRDAAAYVYIVNSLTFVNNKVENSPILTSDKTGAIHSGLRYYGFELTCTDNEFTGFVSVVSIGNQDIKQSIQHLLNLRIVADIIIMYIQM